MPPILKRFEMRSQQTNAVQENKPNKGDERYDRKPNRPKEYKQKETQKQDARQKFVCAFCKGDHISSKCPVCNKSRKGTAGAIKKKMHKVLERGARGSEMQ